MPLSEHMTWMSRWRLATGIAAGRRWMKVEDIERRQNDLRSPAVLRCVRDYEKGQRQSDALLTGMLPLQQNVHRILATADLV